MKHLLIVLYLLLFLEVVFASEKKSEELDVLLEQVRKARLNDVLHKLPNGLRWIEGYIETGRFFPCSGEHGLWLLENELTRTLADYESLIHVEFTAEFYDGFIDVVEIHNITKHQSQKCGFKGQESGK